MSTIVCAIRGGQGSLAVRKLAIQRAREQQLPLVFLSVVDTSIFVSETSASEPAIHAELRWLAQSLVHIAREHALRGKIAARAEVRDGIVANVIKQFVREEETALLLLGAPRGTTTAIFGDDAVEQFARNITQETGVMVEIARPETVL